METRKAYPSDLNDREWAELEPLLPSRRDARGAKARHSRRELLNAIFYVVRQGITWAAMPHDLAPHKTVYDYYRKLQKRGVWPQILDHLRQKLRLQAGRKSEPSVIFLDSQAAKTTEKGGQEVLTPSNA